MEVEDMHDDGDLRQGNRVDMALEKHEGGDVGQWDSGNK